MAYGTPVISYDCPWGPSSIIKDGEDGLLVSNGNIIELSKKLSFLLSNANEVKRLGNNARQNVQRFSMDVIAKQWKALFESVTNDK
jgi:glycosyltransferase involved in cell wall biosynthesis